MSETNNSNGLNGPNSVEGYVEGVLRGDRRTLAKTITLIESTRRDHQLMAQEILEKLLPKSGGSVRLGITGVPGVGKSTFIEAFGLRLIGELGRRVAVLAVDPSSQISGGSIMGDKTRMEMLSREEAAFIRPSPSSGTLGGVARRTRESMLVCEAAGYDVVIIETVGVGQSETAVAAMTDFFLVLMLAGAGDELQGIKRGIMELADAVCITKADGENVKQAELARRRFENALHLLRPPSPNWSPPVLMSSAMEKTGIAEVWETISRHREALEENGEITAKRRRQNSSWMWSMVEDGLKDLFDRSPAVREIFASLQDSVLREETSPTLAARKLLEAFSGKPFDEEDA